MSRSSQFCLARAVRLSVMAVGILFLIRAVEVTFDLPLRLFGIIPRRMAGLPGIIFAPLLHANLSHLLANALPLFVLLILVLTNRVYHPYRSLALIWGLSGLGTWLIGRGQSIHLGASSIIFGLAAFLIVAGLRMKSWPPALISILVFFFYGGIFYGVIPHAGPVSWEGHLCGAIAGAWTARNLRA